ncbi:MAG: AAA family ATPase, partial [Chloroflexota bacterium]|nr:AAA family ATPase [Chloroflexota bacterium]
MIKRVVIRNLKRFKELDCTLADHLVIVGPNNCGKTTLLQAVSFWSEIASHWAQYNSDLARDEDGNYPSSTLHPKSVSSIPLVEWDQLWPARDVTDPVSIRLHVDGQMLGFEVLYNDRVSVGVRPTRDVSESVLDGYRQDPFTPTYIPPMSGVDLQEPPYQPEVIPARLARGQGGTVLRNLLLGVSSDPGKWADLQTIVADLFGYELTLPSAGADEILAGYREGQATL